MEHYPYSTARARWHVFAGVSLAAMGLLFAGVGVLFAIGAVTGDFPAFFGVAAFFVALGALGIVFGGKGASATRRLRANRYGVTIDGDDVRSLEFDPWGDRGFTFSLRDVVGGSEHPRKYRTYLMVELRTGKHRWLPTWRLGPTDRAALYERLGIGAPGIAPRRRHEERSARAATPAPPVVTASVDPVPSAALPTTAPASSTVQTETRPTTVHCPVKLLQVASAWLVATEEVLGIRFLETSGREGDGVFSFGRDEDVRDAPWLEARVHDAFPMTAHGAASEWRHQLLLCNARDAAGSAIDLRLESEMLQDAGWWWDVTSRTIEPAVLTSWRDRFSALHTGREAVRAGWTWLLAPEDRPSVP